MDRRSFLALLASAPIAALAPWPMILEQRQRLSINHINLDAVYAAMIKDARSDLAFVASEQW